MFFGLVNNNGGNSLKKTVSISLSHFITGPITGYYSIIVLMRIFCLVLNKKDKNNCFVEGDWHTYFKIQDHIIILIPTGKNKSRPYIDLTRKIQMEKPLIA